MSSGNYLALNKSLVYALVMKGVVSVCITLPVFLTQEEKIIIFSRKIG